MSYPEQLPQSAMRASTADRDRAVDVLRAAFAEGRLTHEELQQRVGAVLRARTYGDLAELVSDVPIGPMPWQPPQPNPAPPLRPAPRPASRVVARRSDVNEPTAVAALVLGVAGVVLGPPASIGAIVTGHIAHTRIVRNGTGGAGMSTAGLLLGYLGLAVTALVILMVVAGAALGSFAPPPH